MTFDRGSFDAQLTAAVGDDPVLIGELRAAFLDSAHIQLDRMRRSRCDANWRYTAWKLKSLAASFGETHILGLADEAAEGAPGDPVVLRELTEALADQ